jgi:hypothetical protein
MPEAGFSAASGIGARLHGVSSTLPGQIAKICSLPAHGRMSGVLPQMHRAVTDRFCLASLMKVRWLRNLCCFHRFTH